MQDLSGRTLPGVMNFIPMGAEVDFINDERGILTARLDYICRNDFYLTSSTTNMSMLKVLVYVSI